MTLEGLVAEVLSASVPCAVCREELLEPVSQEDLQEMQQALLAAFQDVTGEPLAALCELQKTHWKCSHRWSQLRATSSGVPDKGTSRRPEVA